MRYGKDKPHFRLLKTGWSCWVYDEFQDAVFPCLLGYQSLSYCWQKYNRIAHGMCA